MKGERLSKVLATAGVASRRVCERIIFDGRVAVEGVVTRVPQTLVEKGRTKITVDGISPGGSEGKRYYLLNKPRGYVCSGKREGLQCRVVDLFADVGVRLFTVGRLDRDTTGLLIVTNDGHFAQKVIHPSANLPKEYLVKTVEEVSSEHLARIAGGMVIGRSGVRPLSVKKVRRGTIKVVVKEGKKREVRLLVRNAGLTLLSLSRIRIGNLRLGHLPEGGRREIFEREKNALLQI